MTNLVSELTYVTRDVERPGFYKYQPGEDEPDRAPETRLHEMVVEDARAYLETLDLDREGLAIVLLKTNDSKTAMTVSRFSPFTTRKWNHW